MDSDELQRRVRRQAWDNVAQAHESKQRRAKANSGWCTECGAPWVRAELGKEAYCVWCMKTYPHFDGQRAVSIGVEQDPED